MSSLLRFGSVGVVNTAVGFAVIYAALLAGFGDLLSNALGYGVGLALSFFLHRSWTFAGKTTSLPRDAVGFVAAWAAAYVVNLAVLGLGRAAGWIDNPLVHLLGVLAFAGVFYLLTSGLVFVGGKAAEARNNQAPSERQFVAKDLPLAIFGAVLVLATLAPLLAVKLPPLVDLLGHIGRYAIQTGLEEHPWLSEYFSVRWQLIGNLGADLVVHLLAPVLGVEGAARIALIACQSIAALAILLISRQLHGRITPFAILALPLLYSFPFNLGFVNFTLSMALALLAFAVWLHLNRPERASVRSWLFVPISLGIWVSHTYGWAFLGLLCAAQSLVDFRRAGRPWPQVLWNTGWRCLPLAAPLLPMLIWRGQESVGGSTYGWFLILSKLNWMLSVLRLDHELADRLSAALLLGSVYVGLRSHRIACNPTMVTAASLCLVAFLILPLRALGSHFADMRLAPYIFIVGLLALDDRSLGEHTRRWLTVAAVVFFAIRMALTTTTYIARERELNTQLQALQAIPEGARVATLVSLPCPHEWQLPWLNHLGGLAIARKHAFANDQWATGGMNVVTVHYPRAGDFAHDPSQIVYPTSCDDSKRSLRRSVEELPAHAFTHLWIVGIPPREHPIREGFSLVWRSSDAAVYRIAGER